MMGSLLRMPRLVWDRMQFLVARDFIKTLMIFIQSANSRGVWRRIRQHVNRWSDVFTKSNALWCFVLVGVLLSGASVAQAAIMIDRAIIHFMPGESNRQDVEVYNPDPEPVYLQVELLEVANPGTEKETRNPVGKGVDIEFLATPDKLVIPPKGRKRVRLVVVKPNQDRERVYRVNLKPVVGEIEADQTAIKVVVGYQLLVLVQPVEAKKGLKVERVGKRLMMENTGNINVYVRSIKQCNPNKPTECEESPPLRLYAGNSKTIELKWDTGVELSLSQSMQNSSLEVE